MVGERWSLLIIRDACFAGSTRFGEFAKSLGIAPNILTNRLEGFVAAGLMVRSRIPGNADQHEYILTAKGRSLATAVVALAAWGDQWCAPDGPPFVFEHAACGGGGVTQHNTCSTCGEEVGPTEISGRAGPGWVSVLGQDLEAAVVPIS